MRERGRFLCRSALLVVSEIAYLPVTPDGARLLSQLIDARYGKGAMILTSNRHFREWSDVGGDPVVVTALLDWLLHRAVVVQIESSNYGMRRNADVLPESIRTAPRLRPDARTDIALLPIWLTHHNEMHPHRALGYRAIGLSGYRAIGLSGYRAIGLSGYRSPRESIAQPRKVRSGL